MSLVLENQTQQYAISCGIDPDLFIKAKIMMEEDFPLIMGYYLDEAESRIAQMQRAMNEQDVTKAMIPAHTIKSSSRQFGATTLGDAAYEVELASKNAAPISQVEPLVCRLTELYEAVKPFFESELK